MPETDNQLAIEVSQCEVGSDVTTLHRWAVDPADYSKLGLQGPSYGRRLSTLPPLTYTPKSKLNETSGYLSLEDSQEHTEFTLDEHSHFHNVDDSNSPAPRFVSGTLGRTVYLTDLAVSFRDPPRGDDSKGKTFSVRAGDWDFEGEDDAQNKMAAVFGMSVAEARLKRLVYQDDGASDEPASFGQHGTLTIGDQKVECENLLGSDDQPFQLAATSQRGSRRTQVTGRLLAERAIAVPEREESSLTDRLGTVSLEEQDTERDVSLSAGR